MVSKWRLILVVGMMLFGFVAMGHAGQTDITLGVNGSDIDGRILTHITPNQIPLALGGGILYSDDEDYWITHLKTGIQDEVFVTGLDLGLGFKGVFGEVDTAGDDYGILGLAFEFMGEYDFRRTSRIPVSVSADIAYAPKILSGSDTDSYLEFYTAGFFHINDWAAVFGGFRVLDVDFDRSGVELDDDAFYLGVQLTF